ncbi:MAG: Polyhydroxyalkanoic acid synthase, partial [uncultured Acetobacteraceae bacterium]
GEPGHRREPWTGALGPRGRRSAGPRRDVGHLDLLGGGDVGFGGPGLGRSRQALVADDDRRRPRRRARRRGGAAQRRVGQGPVVAVRGPDVERQPVARHRARGLGGGRQGAPHRVAALPQQARRGRGLGGGAERDPLALGRGGLERGRPALVGRGGGVVGPGRRRRGHRQAVRGAGMARQPGLPHAEGRLPPRLRLAAEAGRGAGGRHGRGGAPAARLPPAAVRGRHEPDAAARLQPGGAAPRDGDRRRQPRQRRAEPPRRPAGRAAQHGGREGLRAGAQHGALAGQGGPPQPLDRADPVRADDRDRAPEAAAHLPALDQQVLHPRLAAEEQHGAPPGGPGLHRVHGVLEEPRRLHGGHDLRGLHGPRPAGSQRRRARDHRRSRGQRDGLLHRRHAARHGARLAGREEGHAVQRGDLHGLDAGLLASGRHRRLHGRARHRPGRAADDGARLPRQPRDVQHVQPAALERPDLGERGEQLPD